MNKKINPGEKQETTLVLTKQMTANETGTYTNIAEVEGLNSKADIIISVSTGIIQNIIIMLVILIVLILLGWINYKYGIIKTLKLGVFIITASITLLSGGFKEVQANTAWYEFENDSGIGDIFYGGPTGKGICIDFGPVPHGICEDNYGAAYYDHSTDSVQRTETSGNNGSNLKMTFNRNNSNIEMKLSGNNYVFGPFNVSCSESGASYSTKAYDSGNNEISGITITGAKNSFYVNIPKDKCKNGVSRIKTTASITKTYSKTIKNYGYSTFYPDRKHWENGWCQRVKSNGEYLISQKTSSGSKPLTKDVEWTKINGCLDIIKTDKDNTNVKLANVSIRVQCTAVGYDKTHKTDANGNIHIDNLRTGTYTLTETSNSNYGYNANATGSVKIVSGKPVSSTMTNEKQTGSLIINKKDKDTNTNLNGVQFRLKQGNNYIRLNNSNSLSGTQRITSLTKTTNASQATTLTTAGGQIKLVNLLVGTYQLEEISVGNNYGYTVNSTKTKVDRNYIYINNSATPIGNNAIDVTVSRQTSTETNNNNTTRTNGINVFNRRKYIKLSGNVWEDIKPIGKGTDFNNTFGNEDTKIQNIKVTLKNSDGTNVSKIENESTFTNPTYTNESGHYEFEDVLINNLDGYYLEFEYDGEIYTTTKSFNELGQNNSNAETNTSKALEVSNQRDIVDNRYNNVAGTTNESQSIVNNNFNVNYNLTRNENTDATAKSVNMATFESQLSETTRNVNQFNGYENYDTINKITATTKETGYGVLGAETADTIRRNAKTELTNRNCGLVQREQVDLSASTDLENVIVKVNGYTNTYMYGKGNRFTGTVEDQYGNIVSGPEDEYRLDVKGQKWGYFRKMYASDIVYNGTDSCEVYLTYGITVRNNSNTLSTKVTNLANYHDSRYTIVKTGLDENMTDSVEATWTGKGDLGNGYTVEYTSALPDIPAIGTRKIFVQYKLDTSAVVSILSGDVSLNDVVEINGYTTYYGANTYYHTGNGTRTGIYASIDRNSAPGNITLGDNRTYEDDTMIAPAVTMQLTTNERSIEGNVFEDMPEAFNGEANEHEAYSGQERIGNGLYEQGKDRDVKNVTVELFEFDEAKQPNEATNNKAIWTESIKDSKDAPQPVQPDNPRPTYVWTKQELGDNYIGDKTDSVNTELHQVVGKKTQARVVTDQTGHYKIEGIIPGKYVLKFTYGDGSVIYKEGTEVKPLDRADYYKSTIVTSEVVRGALENTPKVSSMWYKTTENAGRTSDAVDYLDAYNSSNSVDAQNRTINKSNQKEISKVEKKKAYTAPMNIKFENMNTEVNSDENGTATVEQVDTDGETVLKTNLDGTQQVETVFRYNTQNVDFGIIEKAKQDYQIQKEITNIKVTLANGQVLIDGNPATQNLQYVKYLEHTPFSRSKYIDMEIDNEILVGATLEVTYQVKAINESELNYLTYGYYYFGEDKDESKIEKLTPSKVIDYFDNDLVFDVLSATNNGETETLVGKIKTIDGEDKIVVLDGENREIVLGKASDYLEESVINSAKKYENILILQSKKALAPTQAEQWSYKASRVLTVSDELEFTNEAENLEVISSSSPSEINNLGSLNPEESIEELKNSKETDFYSEQIVITSPTGENRDYTIYIIGTVVLTIVSLGIIIIKRKAL